MPSTPIRNWAIDDRPREKMLNKGAPALSDSELLAILIGNGYKERSALDLAKNILTHANNNLEELGKLSIHELSRVKGIGTVKAITIVAALELGKRRQLLAVSDKTIIHNSQQLASHLRIYLKDHPHEVFAVVFLNRANRIKHIEIVSQGGITGTVADPRIVLKKALEKEATSIVLSHNHPSGSLMPSRADEELTDKIKHAAAYFDIRVLDHIIVSDEGYYSFADEGLI